MEIRQPELDARLARNIAEQLERRVAFRRAMKRAVQRTMRMGAKGIKVRVAGRLGGSEMARTDKDGEGKVPLQTLRADVDFGQSEAATTYGRIGVKVWIYRGDIAPGQGWSDPGLRRGALVARRRWRRAPARSAGRAVPVGRAVWGLRGGRARPVARARGACPPGAHRVPHKGKVQARRPVRQGREQPAGACHRGYVSRCPGGWPGGVGTG